MFSPDGCTLATGSGDGDTRLWSIALLQFAGSDRRDLPGPPPEPDSGRAFAVPGGREVPPRVPGRACQVADTPFRCCAPEFDVNSGASALRAAAVRQGILDLRLLGDRPREVNDDGTTAAFLEAVGTEERWDAGLEFIRGIRIPPLNSNHLLHTLCELESFHNGHRPHRARDQVGGTLHEHHHAARAGRMLIRHVQPAARTSSTVRARVTTFRGALRTRPPRHHDLYPREAESSTSAPRQGPARSSSGRAGCRRARRNRTGHWLRCRS